GGNGKGDELSQLNEPHYLFIDRDHSVYVSDYYNHRVMKWKKGAKEGAGANQFNCPFGLSVDLRGYLYVADAENHRVQRFSIE
ncbi:unnamed protein product, partial [Rotaria magnacalcarata]